MNRLGHGLRTLMIAAMLTGCGAKPEAEAPPAEATAPTPESPFRDLGPNEQQALAVALMRAQFEAGRKLVELGARESAAAHFSRPMGELFTTYSDLFTEVRATPPEVPFVALTEAANAERDPGQLQPLYQPAQQAIADLEPRGPHDRAAVLSGVLKELRLTYGQAVTAGRVSDRVALEDAYGLALVARQMVDTMEVDAAIAADLRTELDRLAALVAGPLPSDAPALPSAVSAQISRLEVTLAGIS